jgi:hypothetical protein
MDATRMLRQSAVGFMIAGSTFRSAIAAKYPEAPAWPTDEYSMAAARIMKASSAMVVAVK